jgi:beta-lactamase superfamily II metal-dependent hydrolase
VFNRIIKDDKYCLRADILKVPHHGSCYNLNQSIINRINPKYAIISHENKHGHPSEEIIKILEINRTQVFLTNDIKKVTTLIASTKQTIGAVASNEIVFI